MESVSDLLVLVCTTFGSYFLGGFLLFLVLKSSKSGALISKCPKPLAVGVY